MDFFLLADDGEVALGRELFISPFAPRPIVARRHGKVLAQKLKAKGDYARRHSTAARHDDA